MPAAQVKGKSFIITGAAGGIGRQLATGLSQKGARLVLTDLHLKELKRAFRESESLILRQMDVTSEAAWVELVPKIGRIVKKKGLKRIKKRYQKKPIP